MVEEPITMGEGPILNLLAPSITRFVGWEWEWEWEWEFST
jgi:hypothetical protein